MTTLLPRKGMTFGARPPEAVAPAPMPKVAASRSPRSTFEEPPTRLFALPTPVPTAAPAAASPVAGPPRSSNRPPPPAEVAAATDRVARNPEPASVPPPSKSDPRIDPPATVVTARTRIITARPTVSWAAAFVAMGLFVGLVTAVVARGDADTLIDATASFVDPSGDHAAAAAGEESAVPTKAEARRTIVTATVDTLLVDPSAVPVVDATPAPAAAPLPPSRPAPVARRSGWHPAPRAGKARGPKGARGGDDDVESASAADALAKAQLDASLR